MNSNYNSLQKHASNQIPELISVLLHQYYMSGPSSSGSDSFPPASSISELNIRLISSGIPFGPLRTKPICLLYYINGKARFGSAMNSSFNNFIF